MNETEKFLAAMMPRLTEAEIAIHNPREVHTMTNSEPAIDRARMAAAQTIDTSAIRSAVR